MLTLDNLTEQKLSPEDLLPSTDPEETLKGLRGLYQNPYYVYLLALLAVEERQATGEVFRQGSANVAINVPEHFKWIGLTLGLVRIKDLHLGKIDDLEQQLKEQSTQKQNANTTRPEPGSADGHEHASDPERAGNS